MRGFERPATISETIYQYLKKAINSGELKPNQRVQEKTFARLFQVSSTPVREAFLKLAAEKYLVVDARKEVRVRATTPEEVRELYEIVRTLDCLAVRRAVKKITDQEIARLSKMTARLGNFYEQRKVVEYLNLNLKIHHEIWKSCGNNALRENLVELMNKIGIFRQQAGFSPFAHRAALQKSYSDHRRIMAALERRDLTELEKIIAVHWGEEFEANLP